MSEERWNVLLALSVASLGRWLASLWTSRNRRDQFVRVGQVSDLSLFPVKSCQGIPLQKARAEVTGLVSEGLYDRCSLSLSLSLSLSQLFIFRGT